MGLIPIQTFFVIEIEIMYFLNKRWEIIGVLGDISK